MGSRPTKGLQRACTSLNSYELHDLDGTPYLIKTKKKYEGHSLQ